MTKTLYNKDAVDKLKSMVDEIEVCMFCTWRDRPDISVTELSNTWKEPRDLNSRPMLTLRVEDDGKLRFLADNLSEMSMETNKESHVYLNYSHPGKHDYLFVSGTAIASEDRGLIEELWTPSLKAWFPSGKEDPRLMLLTVVPREAYYWDNVANKMEDLFSKLKSAITGNKHEDGEQGKLML